MANTKQAQKYIRKTETRTDRNRAVRSRLRTLAKKLRSLEEVNDDSKKLATEYASALDKAAKRNIIHVNNANRNKAAVSKFLFAGAK
ncbi:MAG: 30S ribosomal protein S20 [Verrucomicrobiota bacterium]